MRREAIVRGLRALWPALMVLAGAGAFGLMTKDLPAAPVSALAGLTLLVAAWLFYRAVADFTPIDEQEAKHRIESAAGLSEMAPLTSSADRLVGGDGALWSWHRRRLEVMAGALSKPAKPKVVRQDWLKLIALMLGVGICIWQPVSASRALSFDASPLLGDSDLVLDAWAQPPEYTGLPVIRLSRDTPAVSVPEGSIISARMDGAKGAPRLRVGGATQVMVRERGQTWSGKAVIHRSAVISLDRFGSRARWDATVIKDLAPVLSSEEPIRIDQRGRLDVAFSAKDDYGIAATFLRITPKQTPAGLIGHDTFETPLLIEGEANEDGARRVFVDVADHVLTGLEVTVRLVVRDGLGQETSSKVTELTLPKVEWKTQLGAALQEQRLEILRETRPFQTRPPSFATLFDGQSGLPIKLSLDEPLLGAPAGIVRAHALLGATLTSLKVTGLSEVGLMALQFARERLAIARNVEDAHAVGPILWQMAMQAEIADQTPAQQKIAAAREALEQALKNGASPEELAQLNQELREAVGERLEELAQQGSQGEGNSQGQGGNSVSGGDIDSMLRELEQSGSSGARQDALEQLEKLAEMMANLEAGGSQNGQAGQSGQSGQASGAGPLDDAMREQQDLSDETTRRRNQNEDAPGSDPAPDLAERQKALADRLAAPSGDEASPQEPEDQAGKTQAAQAMRDAAEALRRGDLAGASEAQARAEQALQQAAQAQAGRDGTGNQDPLGRVLPNMDDGRGTKVPDQVERRRARDVREELRRRQADPNREEQERNYLDRLLKDR
jgi:Domain of unknown function (DUF4175)